MTRIRIITGALAIAVLGAVASTAAPSAVRASAPSTDESAGSGWARFGHFAPGASAVDFFVDGVQFATGVTYKTVSTYEPLDAGLHRFEVRAAGQPDSTDLIDTQAGVAAGGAVTIGAVSTRDGIAPQVYDDVLASPPAGQALVRFIHASPGVAAVDVQVDGGPRLASDVPYPDATDYQAITPGQYDVDVLASGTSTVLLHINGWSVAPGTQASIVIIDGVDGQLDVAPIQDSSAAPVAPTGGVQTDGGDPRSLIPPSSVPVGSLVLLGGVASLALALVLARRRSAVAAG